MGTVAGRVGYLFTPTLLIYARGGLAYGGVSVSTASSVQGTELTSTMLAITASWARALVKLPKHSLAGTSAAASSGCSCRTGA